LHSSILFSNATPTTEIYTHSLHDALPICEQTPIISSSDTTAIPTSADVHLFADPDSITSQMPLLFADCEGITDMDVIPSQSAKRDRKSTRLNSSHVEISYAVFCLKKKK